MVLDRMYHLPVAVAKEDADGEWNCICPRCEKEMNLAFLEDEEPAWKENFKATVGTAILILALIGLMFILSIVTGHPLQVSQIHN